MPQTIHNIHAIQPPESRVNPQDQSYSIPNGIQPTQFNSSIQTRQIAPHHQSQVRIRVWRKLEFYETVNHNIWDREDIWCYVIGIHDNF